MVSRKAFLENEIRRHNYLYWVENKPQISDSEYDKLVNELAEIDPDNELIAKIHTPKVFSNGKVKHLKPMLSLEKAYSVDEVLKWCRKVKRSDSELFVLQPKYDGVSGELFLGVLSTRGDGVIGEDITNKLSIIKILKGGVVVPGTDCKEDVRGEIVILKSEFEEVQRKIPRKDGQPYKNLRNAVGGILNRDDIDSSVGLLLTLIDFGWASVYLMFEGIDEFDWKRYIEVVKSSDFPADGLVVKVADPKYVEELGATSHHSKSEISLKFENPCGETILIDVVGSLGKHTVTPIGRVKPVEVSGITIKNVNLHNWKYVQEHDLHIGDIVIVERAGDVIPDIKSSSPGDTRKEIRIDTCPVCGDLLDYAEPELICINDNCPGKHVNILMDAVTRIGIERLGLPTLKKMVATLGVSDLVDVFNLTKEDILAMDGFGETSTQNLFNEIQKVKQNGVEEWQILASLNLPGIGRTLSQKLLEQKSLEELRSISVPEFITFNDIGFERASVIVEGLFANSYYIDRLLETLPIKERQVVSSDMITVCMTGKFDRKKSEYKKLFEPLGILIVDDVKDGIDYLVCDELKGSTKQRKAEKLGIPIITSTTLFLKFGEYVVKSTEKGDV